MLEKVGGLILSHDKFAYNNKVHAGTKVSPFQANYGQDP